MSDQPRRQLLVDTAARLFNRFGYHATGIDRILAESGVSKATLYKHFSSKDALILTVLEQRHDQVMDMAENRIRTHVHGVRAPVLAIFDALEDWFQSADFNGCGFMKACSEFSDPTSEIHKVAVRHKLAIRSLIERHLQDTNAAVRREQSDALMLLFDGAVVRAQFGADANPAGVAKKAAQRLLQA